ncbi:chromate efflux transporter [Cohnella hashimotonis]|uniref:Chromate efflux transporter n=1 Tax=Cohnella hashimotonis TaxID=2826895 RepID=A0ABT6TS27_9BACL|nr:chromate efflux transporter [Cohnella hashimotonis]MDI4649028.1 chromate efflux transporter [Cohnella hashimotonis]
MIPNRQEDSRTHGKGRLGALLEVLAVSTKLGLTSFGGPIAHLGYFHDEYVRRRKWMDERSYADLVALCQLLPGPASSQVGIGIGVSRAGLLGGLAAWLGFTLPSVVALVLFAYFVRGYDIGSAGWIHGLQLVAVAIVAQAVTGMKRQLAPDRGRATVAVLAAAGVLLWQSVYTQALVIVAAGLVGWRIYRQEGAREEAPGLRVPVGRIGAVVCLALFAILLAGLPLLRSFGDAARWLAMFDGFYRSGALVFGGGHVVLPLLERVVVPAGWVSLADFSAGYGAAQAVPGPLFTFAAYLGTMAGGIAGAAIAIVGIFLPAFLLVVGALPFWNALRGSPSIRGALAGINAAVVGILLAALYDPLWTTAVARPADAALALLLFLLLAYWKLPPWAVVLAGAAGGMLLGLLPV